MSSYIQPVGMWVKTPKYKNDCNDTSSHQQDLSLDACRPLRCCNSKHYSWNFKFFDENIKNNESALTDLKGKLKGKHVYFIGDSLMRNFHLSLIRILGIGE